MTHSVTAALAHLLAAAGAVAPHTGLPYSEALLLGLGGGVGAGCFAFDFAGRPCRRLGFRHRWEDDLRFVENVLGRLGVEPIMLEAHGPAGAAKCLDRLLAQGLPVMAWVDPGHLPWANHPGEVLVVLSAAEDDLLVATPVQIRRIAGPALATARNARPSHKNRLIAVSALPAATDLAAAVTEGLAACVERLLQPPVPEFGLDVITRLEPDQILADAIELDTGGCAFRLMFAAFLDEAATATGQCALHECAEEYRSLAVTWNRLAIGCRSGAGTEWLALLAAAELTTARHLQSILPAAHTH